MGTSLEGQRGPGAGGLGEKDERKQDTYALLHRAGAGAQGKSGAACRPGQGDGMPDPAGSEGLLHVPGLPPHRKLSGRDHGQRPLRGQAGGGVHGEGEPHLLPRLPGGGDGRNPLPLRTRSPQLPPADTEIQEEDPGGGEEPGTSCQPGVLHPGGPRHLRPLRSRLPAGHHPGKFRRELAALAGRPALPHALRTEL